MSVDYRYVGRDAASQKKAVELLKRCFEEWHFFESRFGTRFPFIEESFMAFDAGGNALGHVGIMPFDISDGNGGCWKVAGIASVGVAPEARKQGIADRLCKNAGAWAAENGFDLMLLYTAAGRVYEKSGFQRVMTPACSLLKRDVPAAGGEWKNSAVLTPCEKALIKELYNNADKPAGRVIRRENEEFFHSWHWYFTWDYNQWRVAGNSYALLTGGVLSEICGDPDEYPVLLEGVDKAFISDSDPVYKLLQKNGFTASNAPADLPECWHGECAMQKFLTIKEQNLFFPLADKF